MSFVLMAETSKAVELRAIDLKIGYANSARSGSESDFFARINGVCAGVGLEWSLGTTLSLHTDLEYVRRGWVIEDIPLTDGRSVDYQTAFDRLAIPLLLGAHTEYSSVRPFVQVGPRLDFILDVDDDLSGEDHPDHLRTVVLGGTLAAGAQLTDLSPILLTAMIRYNFDLTDADNLEYFETRTNAFELWLSIGYALGELGIP